MQLLSPAFLWLSVLAIIPIVLYLFRRKSKRIDVSTMVFFKSLAREHQESAWLRRLKKLLSFLLTLAVLLGVVFALSRVVFSPKADDMRTVVMLLDRSASMAVEDGEGNSRLDLAKAELKTRLDGIPEDVGVALIAYDRRPEIVQPRTLNRRELISRIDAIAVRPVSQDEAAAIESALTLAQLETPTVIWHASDHPIVAEDEAADQTETAQDAEDAEEPQDVAEMVDANEPAAELADDKLAVDLPEDVRLEFVDFALPAPVNVGFTAFQIRRVPLVHSKFEVFVRVGLNRAAPEAVTARLEVNLGGMPVQLRDIELEPGASEELVLPVEGAEDQLLHLRLRASGDVLATDNDILAPLPRSRPVVAAVISPQLDPFTEIALMAIQEQGELVMWKGTPESWPLDEAVDVVIFDSWLPEEWPTDIPAVVINPPNDAGPIRARPLSGAGVPYESIRASDENHPLLFRVSSSRISLTQTVLYQVDGSLQPLWLAGNDPVMSAGEVRGQRLVVMGFSVAQSERLALTASFPILMGNALLWCAENSQAVTERVRENRTGDLIDVHSKQLTWTEWKDGQARKSRVVLDDELLELERVGLWQSDDGGQGTSYLLSRVESDVPGSLQANVDSRDVAAESSGKSMARKLFLGDITWLIIAVVVALLVLENWLFHRHAVY